MQLTPSTVDRQVVVQNAYHVADVDLAVERFNSALGIGPFLMRRNLALPDVRYRGQPGALTISVAHAQAGDIQIELVQQHGDEPSAFRDMYAHDETGFHHVAVIPDDHDAMVQHYRAIGFDPVTELRTEEGRGATYVDTRPLLGHMLEIYFSNPSLIALYEQVDELSRKWDSKTLRVEA